MVPLLQHPSHLLLVVQGKAVEELRLVAWNGNLVDARISVVLTNTLKLTSAARFSAEERLKLRCVSLPDVDCHLCGLLLAETERAMASEATQRANNSRPSEESKLSRQLLATTEHKLLGPSRRPVASRPLVD